MDLWQRTEQPLPCPKHGHPGWLCEDNQTLWELYEAVAGNVTLQTYQRGDKTVTKSFLNPLVVQVVFEWWEIPADERQTMFQRLQQLHEELTRE